MRKLARVVLHGRDFEHARLWPGHAEHPVQRDGQVVSIQCPHQFRLRRHRVSHGYRDLPSTNQLHGAPLALAVWQVEDQPVAGLGLGVAIKLDYLAVYRRDTPAHGPASQQFVGNRDDVARQRDTAIQANLERYGPVLGVGQQCPLAAALGLGFAVTCNSADLQRVITVTPLQLLVSNRSDVGVVVILTVVVADQGPAIAGTLRCAGICELAINNVRAGVGEVEVRSARHIRQGEDLALGPVSHAPIDRRDISQQRPGVSLALKVEVADKAWLHPTLSVRYKLIAVLRDAVQLPLVDHPRLNAAAEAEAVVRGDAVGVPDGIVRPSLFKGAIPHACIAARARVVVTWNLPLSAITYDSHGRNAAELLGGKLDVEQRGVRVADLCVDHLGETGDLHGVRDFVVVLVGRDTGDAHQPASSGLRQIDTARTLVHAGGLAVDSFTKHLLIRAAISRQLNLVFDPVPIDVAPGVHGLERRPSESYAHGRKLGVADRSNPRRTAAQLSADRRFVFDRRDALDIGLVHRPGTPLPLHVREVHVALGVLQWGPVEADIAIRRRAFKLALANSNQHLCNCH